jgi:hypothetical protein
VDACELVWTTLARNGVVPTLTRRTRMWWGVGPRRGRFSARACGQTCGHLVDKAVHYQSDQQKPSPCTPFRSRRTCSVHVMSGCTGFDAESDCAQGPGSSWGGRRGCAQARAAAWRRTSADDRIGPRWVFGLCGTEPVQSSVTGEPVHNRGDPQHTHAVIGKLDHELVPCGRARPGSAGATDEPSPRLADMVAASAQTDQRRADRAWPDSAGVSRGPDEWTGPSRQPSQ